MMNNSIPPNQPRLNFRMPLTDDAQEELVVGILQMYGSTYPYHEFQCTSGQPRWQYTAGVCSPGRGPLPSCKAAGIDRYTVGTVPIWSPDIAGIRGNFFPISPETVEVGGVKRRDFGIHNDANRADSPGSAGCIVFLFDRGWEIFQQEMHCWKALGVEQVPLIVSH